MREGFEPSVTFGLTKNSASEALRLAQLIAALRIEDLQIRSDLRSHRHDPEQIEDGKNKHTSRLA